MLRRLLLHVRVSDSVCACVCNVPLLFVFIVFFRSAALLLMPQLPLVEILLTKIYPSEKHKLCWMYECCFALCLYAYRWWQRSVWRVCVFIFILNRICCCLRVVCSDMPEYAAAAATLNCAQHVIRYLWVSVSCENVKCLRLNVLILNTKIFKM